MEFKYNRPDWCKPLTERDREIEFLLKAIHNDLENKQNLSILDVGFAGSGYIDNILELGNVSYTGIDGSLERITGEALDLPETSKKTFSKEKWREVLSKIKFIHQDIITYSSDTKYDIVMSVSVIEHIVPMGYNIYEEFDYYRDLKAVESMKNLVKEDGKLLLTFPCGRHIIFSNTEHPDFTKSNRDIMIYDSAHINKLIGDWKILKEKYYLAPFGKFSIADKDEATNFAYTTPKIQSLCILLLER